jgi:anti-sigma B factor antagonist
VPAPADHQVLPLEGEIDLHNSAKVAAALKGAIKEQPKKLVVDLSQVSYIDSSGLAVLLEGMQNVEFYGGKLYLIGLQESLRTIFETSRLNQAFRIFPNIESALAA